MATDPILGLTLPSVQDADNATFTEIIVWTIAIAYGKLKDHDYDASGGAPTLVEGELWHIASSPSPTGDWAGQGGNFALGFNGDWLFATPVNSSRQFTSEDGNGASGPHKSVFWDNGSWTEVATI